MAVVIDLKDSLSFQVVSFRKIKRASAYFLPLLIPDIMAFLILSVFFLLGGFGLVVAGFGVLGFDAVNPRALFVAAAFSFRILLAAAILDLSLHTSAYRSSDLASSSASHRFSSAEIFIAFDIVFLLSVILDYYRFNYNVRSLNGATTNTVIVWTRRICPNDISLLVGKSILVPGVEAEPGTFVINFSVVVQFF
jgi:hypothetical protein